MQGESKLAPAYPLRDVKALLRANHYQVNDPALQSAYGCFLWGPDEIVKCLLRLNNKPHNLNREKNHFHKTVPHTSIPNTEMDYYKIKNASEGNKVYTHFYIRNFDGKLIISSFKELIL